MNRNKGKKEKNKIYENKECSKQKELLRKEKDKEKKRKEEHKTPPRTPFLKEPKSNENKESSHRT